MSNADEWRLSPLSGEDFIAGLSLIFIAVFSISVYVIMMTIMKRQDKEIVGYRFLISAGFSDLLLLFNYGIWPGLTILTKSEIIPKNWRTWQQVRLPFNIEVRNLKIQELIESQKLFLRLVFNNFLS